MAVQERSAGFIVYRIRPGSEPVEDRVEYLLLDYGRHWDFPKGHLEKGEDDLAAARRELEEETGLRDVTVVPGFAHEITYFFRHKSRGLIRKSVAFLLARTESDQITLSREHKAYLFLPIEAATRQVTFRNAREVLALADAQLRANPAYLKEG